MLKRMFFLTVGLLMIIISCKKDKLTGDIKEINEVKIGGINPSYTASLGVPLVITPDLSFTQDNGADDSRYVYEWFSAESVKTHIASTKNLNAAINLVPGLHPNIFYRVKDLQTGVQWSMKFSITVVTSIYEGWMVLNDVDGTARLDMVSVKANVYTTIHDVLSLTGSALKLTGAPLNISCFQLNNATYGIYVSAKGTGTTKIDPETFAWDKLKYISYESMIPSIPDNFGADFVQPKGNQYSSYIYKDGTVYFYRQSSGFVYSVPVNVMKGSATEFKAAPFVATVLQGDFAIYGPSILYDATNRKFVNQQAADISCSQMPAGTLFNYTTGKDMVYMSSTNYNGSFANGDVFAILKDPNVANFYLARMSLAAFGVSFQQNYWDIMTATDIGLAEHFAVSSDLGYIFYSVGGKLYEYDMFLKKSTLMLDKGVEKISMLRFQTFLFPFAAATTKYSNKLIVGSYDPSKPSASNGSLEIFTVAPVNGPLKSIERYDGFGKIVDISYRERK